MEGEHDATEHSRAAAAFFLSLVLRDGFGRRRGDRFLQRFQPRLGIAATSHHRIAGHDLRIGLSRVCLKTFDRALLHQLCCRLRCRSRDLLLVVAHQLSFFFVGTAQHIQSFVGLAEQRICVGQRFQPRNSRRPRLAQIVEAPNFKLTLCQDFLDVAELLLGLGNKFAIGILQNKLAIFFLGAARVRGITIGLLHLLEMDVGHLHLRFCRFRHVREKGLKILIFDFGLLQRSSTAFGIPGVPNRQLGARHELGIGIGIDKRLQRHACNVVLAMVHRVHGTVEEHLIGLFRVDVGNWVRHLVVVATGDKRHQERKRDEKRKTTKH